MRRSHRNTSTPLTGKGKLTDKIVNSLQNYYGIAIRGNVGNLYQIKKAVGAILWHCTNYDDDDKRYQYCPRDATSWCKYQKDKVAGTQTYKKTINIPVWINELLKPVFKDLSSDHLLSQCLHGKTQNANEALNNIIWHKCPKGEFVERDLLECAVNSVILQFNEGPNAVFDILKHFGFTPGVVTTESSNKRTHRRIQNIARKMSQKGKKRRKQLRSIKKGYADREKQQEEGESYIPGGF